MYISTVPVLVDQLYLTVGILLSQFCVLTAKQLFPTLTLVTPCKRLLLHPNLSLLSSLINVTHLCFLEKERFLYPIHSTREKKLGREEGKKRVLVPKAKSATFELPCFCPSLLLSYHA